MWPEWWSAEGIKLTQRPLAWTIFAFSYCAIMIIVGLYLLYKGIKLRRGSLKILGFAIFIVGFNDTFHGLAIEGARAVGTTHIPGEFPVIPTAAMISIVVFCIFQLLLITWKYKALKKPINKFGWFSYLFGLITIILVILPYNWWLLEPPEGAINTRPITGTFLLILGILVAIHLIGYYREKISRTEELKPVTKVLLRIFLVGTFLLIISILLVILHGMFQALGLPEIALTIITAIKLGFLIISVILYTLSLVPPHRFLMWLSARVKS